MGITHGRGTQTDEPATEVAPAADERVVERDGPLTRHRVAGNGATASGATATGAVARRPVADDEVVGEERRVVPGASLARGPALILGTILLAAGLYFLYREHFFPKLSSFPNGHAHVEGKAFLGIFGVNGWSGMLTAICGGLLLFGAAQHLLAKTMSLIVGIVLAAATIIALVNSGNVLGLAAANGWTKLLWGASAVILLVNTLLPRRRHVVAAPAAPAAAAVPAGRRTTAAV